MACALGHAYGPQQERGVYRTVDGGKNWERVLFVDENTGCSELDMDPTNPRKLFAGMWQVDIKTWGRESGGAGSGLFTSNDGGTTWTRLRGQGLPTREVGKVKVAIAPSNADQRLRDDRNGRRHSMERPRDRSRPGVALGGRRPQLARGQLTATRWAARTTTRTSSLSPDNENEAASSRRTTACRSTAARRWSHKADRARPAAIITTCGSIPPTATA